MFLFKQWDISHLFLLDLNGVFHNNIHNIQIHVLNKKVGLSYTKVKWFRSYSVDKDCFMSFSNFEIEQAKVCFIYFEFKIRVYFKK